MYICIDTSVTFAPAGAHALLGTTGGKVVKKLRKSKAITSKSSENILGATVNAWIKVAARIFHF